MSVYGQEMDLPGCLMFWRNLVTESVPAPQKEHDIKILFFHSFYL